MNDFPLTTSANRSAGRPAAALLSFLLGVVILCLQSCSWVDSTGAQNEGRVVTLEAGTVVDVIESQPLTLDPTQSVDPLGEVSVWRWSDFPLESGNLASCRGVNGFNEEFVQPNLTSACTREGDCELDFVPVERVEDDVARTVFSVEPPVLRAPVGVTYQLQATREDGGQTLHDFTFCLISINEAPDAADDAFTLIAGEAIRRDSAGVNLLQNDSDDIDTSNEQLRVSTTAIAAPRFAGEFELFDDGTFIYVPMPGRLGTDSFTYQITDGSSPSQATVSIVVTAANADPIFSGPIEDFPIVAGLPVSFSFADYFSDPEGAELQFSATGLPPGLSLSPSGVLEGVPDAAAAGDYRIFVSASDGRAVLETRLDVTVDANQRVVAERIPDQSTLVGTTFGLSASRYFSDPEGQPLLFSLSSPNVVSLSIDRNTGDITGEPAVSGSFLLQITASDRVTQPRTQTVVLDVNDLPNRAPSYQGSIANQVIELGEPITPVAPLFSDPDDDSLSFDLVGDVPRGLSIDSDTGIVTGTPRVTGRFTLSIEASDPEGRSASSDSFRITVNEPTPNQAPEYDGSIPNQTFVAGTAITPFGGDFSDPDGDSLSFSVSGGTLPGGLSISADGVIVGTPLRAGRVTGLRIVATDPDGAIARSDTFRIIVEEPIVIMNAAPVFTPLQDQAVEVGDEIEFFIIATDADGDTLSYDLSGAAAAYLEIDEDTGLIEGEFDDPGTFQAIVSATDGLDETSISFVFDVTGADIIVVPGSGTPSGTNRPPVVTDIPNRVVSGSFFYDVSFVFADPDGDELTFTTERELPAGVSMNQNGVISGVAAAVNNGTHFVEVTADDGRGGSVTDGFRLIIIGF